jgi:S-adenosylmethionine decarboxylase
MKRKALTAPEVVRPFDQTTPTTPWPEHQDNSIPGMPVDHFVERDGIVFAGTHLILDLWGAKHLDDLHHMETTLRECVDACRATLLHIHLHHFTPNGGISGVAVLAESHISVHTWPERDFAAFDIFMCGHAKPEESIVVIKRSLVPKSMTITENLRGVRGYV